MNRLVASAPTIERLESLAQKYFYSPSVRIIDNKLFNSKGEIPGAIMVKKNGRYMLEFTSQPPV